MAEKQIIGCADRAAVEMETHENGSVTFHGPTSTQIMDVLLMVAARASKVGYWTAEEGEPVRLTAHGEALAETWRATR